MLASPLSADTQTVTKLAGLNLSAEGRKIAEKIQQVFPDAPIMLFVANCESAGLVHREPDGSLKRNETGGSARGVFQVLMGLHDEELQRRGLNPHYDADYFRFVRILYDQGKLQPWAESSACWKQYNRPEYLNMVS